MPNSINYFRYLKASVSTGGEDNGIFPIGAKQHDCFTSRLLFSREDQGGVDTSSLGLGDYPSVNRVDRAEMANDTACPCNGNRLVKAFTTRASRE
jgi:hypothetical protein